MDNVRRNKSQLKDETEKKHLSNLVIGVNEAHTRYEKLNNGQGEKKELFH